MDRRQFCISSLALVSQSPLDCQAFGARKSVEIPDECALWSLLIPSLDMRPTKGILVLNQTAAPGWPPVELQPYNGRVKTLSEVEASRYQTPVPPERRMDFKQAVERLRHDAPGEWLIECGDKLPSAYRLISEEEAQRYLDLMPMSFSQSWKTDPEVLKKYEGFNVLISVSKPYFNKAHNFAMVWASVRPSCSISGWFFFRKRHRRWFAESWKSRQLNTCG